jgi:Zn-dependent protease with chaperone function
VALWLIDSAWGLILPAAILLTGFSARMRNWALRVSRRRVITIAIYFAIFSVVTFVIDLPRAYYEDFVREHAYGLSNQTQSKWFGDALKSLVIGTIIGALFLWVPYLLLRKSPRRWWLYTAFAAVPFLLLTLLIAPVWIDPMFNTFGPMKNKSLETKILHLADRAGIEGGRVYEVDKSTDTNALNAYVAGVGRTKRIVLWDTIIARLDESQLLFVMGHEMGHYVLHHIWKELAVFSVLIAGLLYVVHRLAGAVIRALPGAIWLQRALGYRVAAAHPGPFQPRVLRRQPGFSRDHAALRARGRSVRSGDHACEPAGGVELRTASAGQSGESAPALDRAAVPRVTPDAGRTDRVRQQLSPLGDRAAAGLRTPFQVRRAAGTRLNRSVRLLPAACSAVSRLRRRPERSV